MSSPSVPVAPGSSDADSKPTADDPAPPERIADRYQVCEVLGRGGMGTVYRVVDSTTDRTLALKQLQLRAEAHNRALLEALFEQEYRLLVQLDHPRVIHVYDYGLALEGAYYTMELLDGGNLTELAPLPWREACLVVHDVCSSLALLHARRLIHRDVSPHNVRRTRDGRAKLIDFGAMAPMGPNDRVVGTPAFMSPEVAHRLTLDARTDLFSLGATLYFALTGRLAYPARNFAQLLDVWSVRPLPPSAISRDVPERLDALVMSMLSLGPALRPRTASEVMEQLATLAGIEEDAQLDPRRVYLATPELIGRNDLLAKLKRRAASAVNRSGPRRGSALLLVGASGSGRSRALDACALEAKTHGALVLRTGAEASGGAPFALAHSLALQLCELLPQASLQAAADSGTTQQLFKPDASGTLRLAAWAPAESLRATLPDALVRFWLKVAEGQPLALAIDDVDRADEASGAWLATLADQLKRQPILLFCSAHERGVGEDALLQALVQRSSVVPLPPLTAAEVDRLCRSVFGDVPNLDRLSDSVYRVSQGNPRACLELVQQLVDRGRLQYRAGVWSLPAELDPAELPATMDQALAARLAQLSESARWLAELHALSIFDRLSLEDHVQLAAGVSRSDQVSRARSELLAQGILSGDGRRFKLSQEAWSALLNAPLRAQQRSQHHRALAELGLARDKPRLPIVYHLLHSGQPARALELIDGVLGAGLERAELIEQAQLPAARVAQIFIAALAAAEADGGKAHRVAELQRWGCSLSVLTDEAYYAQIAPRWLATLQRDSGLRDWHALAEIAEPAQRLAQALTQAAQRHDALPESERSYRVDEAIKHLMYYTVVSIAFAGRTLDAALVRSLSELLTPLTPLSPLIAAMRENALATRESMVEGQFFQARERWSALFERLDEVQGEARRWVAPIREAIAAGLGTLEATRGMLGSVQQRLELLEQSALTKVDAMYLRKVMLLQQGDFEGAERCRRQAELLSLQTGSRPMFSTRLLVELSSHAMAHDLAGVRQASEPIKQLAARYPGWLPYAYIADGQFELLRGDAAAAKQAFAAALALCTPVASDPARAITPWPHAVGSYLQALIALGSYDEARRYAEQTLADCARLDVRGTDEVVRGLAVAEAKLGDYATAAARLHALILDQRAQGVSGLHLGASYEARARIAIAAGDHDALIEYGKLAAEEYRHGRGSGLGARYEQLMAEAQRSGIEAPPQWSEFETSMLGPGRITSAAAVHALVSAVLRSATSTEQRAESALRLLCETAAADGGYLYLVRADGSVAYVAGRAAAQPGDSELDHARECLDSALNLEIAAPATTSWSSSLPPTPGVTQWTTSEGVQQQGLLLTAPGPAAPRHVAVALLISPRERDALPPNHPLLTTLGERLLEAGDTAGLAAP